MHRDRYWASWGSGRKGLISFPSWLDKRPVDKSLSDEVRDGLLVLYVIRELGTEWTASEDLARRLGIPYAALHKASLIVGAGSDYGGPMGELIGEGRNGG